MPQVRQCWKDSVRARMNRQKAFFDRNERGDFLYYISRARGVRFVGHFTRIIEKIGVEALRAGDGVERAAAELVRSLRDYAPTFHDVDDDALPMLEGYLGIGAITAEMTGRPATFSGGTSWCEPNLEWDEIRTLAWTPETEWCDIFVRAGRAILNLWDEDFHYLPHYHRSPLDAANGIRGTELFAEMHEAPESVNALIRWCADWSIKQERFLNNELSLPAGWGVGAWQTWLPDGGVFVNGDPAGLISREMQPEFEGAHTGHFFSSVGGGYFHHHSIGLHQVDLVAQTPGMLVQEILPDPKLPSGSDALINDPIARERILSASMVTPIMLDGVRLDQIDLLLPIIAEGRFILSVNCQEPRWGEAADRLRAESPLH